MFPLSSTSTKPISKWFSVPCALEIIGLLDVGTTQKSSFECKTCPLAGEDRFSLGIGTLLKGHNMTGRLQGLTRIGRWRKYRRENWTDEGCVWAQLQEFPSYFLDELISVVIRWWTQLSLKGTDMAVVYTLVHLFSPVLFFVKSKTRFCSIDWNFVFFL